MFVKESQYWNVKVSDETFREKLVHQSLEMFVKTARKINLWITPHGFINHFLPLMKELIPKRFLCNFNTSEQFFLEHIIKFRKKTEINI